MYSRSRAKAGCIVGLRLCVFYCRAKARLILGLGLRLGIF